MSPAESFVYQPLKDPANIRVIYVEPGDGPLALSLYEVSLDAQYNTLSYIWSDAAHTIPITVEKAFQITKNLHGFLTHMPYSAHRVGRYWVDALRINQMKDEEKIIQVGMMDKIYKTTEKCVVWLGEHEEDTTRAFGS